MPDTPPASLPAPPAADTSDWGGYLAPPDVAGTVINTLVNEAPFAASLTRRPTSPNKVVFPLASPTGASWLAELQRFPDISLNDSTYEIAVTKLGGLVDLSNELISDSSINVTAEFSRLLGDSLSPQLDQGLLFGDGPPEPAGVVAVATAVAGPDLLQATAAAIGAISDAGGAADTIASAGSAFAVENVKTTTTAPSSTCPASPPRSASAR